MANDYRAGERNEGRRAADLLPPANLFRAEVPNFGPVVDPPFVDVPDFSQYLTPANITPVVVESLEPRVTHETRQQEVDVALASDSVSSLLQDKRHAVLAVGTRSLDRQTDYPLVIIYNYTDDVVVEATIIPERKAVHEVTVGRYQPPVTDAEHNQALEIVRSDGQLTDYNIDVDTGVALIVEDVNFQSRRFGHRLVDLRFGPANRYLPTAFAIVDLSAQEVVTSGPLPQEELS
jgi:hypothetical protein